MANNENQQNQQQNDRPMVGDDWPEGYVPTVQDAQDYIADCQARGIEVEDSPVPAIVGIGLAAAAIGIGGFFAYKHFKKKDPVGSVDLDDSSSSGGGDASSALCAGLFGHH